MLNLKEVCKEWAINNIALNSAGSSVPSLCLNSFDNGIGVLWQYQYKILSNG